MRSTTTGAKKRNTSADPRAEARGCAAQLREPPVQVESITVRAGRLSCEVRVRADARYTTPALAAEAVRLVPDLPRHACVNDCGRTFGDVMEATSVPHLLEHVVIDLQVRSGDGAADTFVGTTEWLDERAGRALVQVSFVDDLCALRALTEASDLLNRLIAQTLPG